MMFGMISVIGSLMRQSGKITVSVYKEILKKYAVPNLRYAINQPTVFMKDNAQCQTVKSVKTFLSEVDFTVMDCPAQNPDMNPIVNFWILNERAKKNNH